MAFDYEAARKEGYSDQDIASYLATQKGFNLQGALKEGYEYDEIISHLTGRRQEAKTAIPQPAAVMDVPYPAERTPRPVIQAPATDTVVAPPPARQTLPEDADLMQGEAGVGTLSGIFKPIADNFQAVGDVEALMAGDRPAPSKPAPPALPPIFKPTPQTISREEYLHDQGYSRNQVEQNVGYGEIAQRKLLLKKSADRLNSIKAELSKAKDRERFNALLSEGKQLENAHNLAVADFNKTMEGLGKNHPLYQSQYTDPWHQVIGKTLFGSAPLNIARGMAALGGAVEELAPTLPAEGMEVGGIDDVSLYDREAMQKAGLGSVGMKAANEYGKLAEEFGPKVLPGTPKAWVSSALESLALNIPTAVAGMATGSLALPLVGMGMISGGQKYADLREKRPDIALPLAAMVATGSGVMEGLTELIPLKTLFRTDIGFGKKLLNEMLQEIPTEMFNTVYNDIQDKMTTNPNMTWGDFLQNQIDTIMSTAIATPMMTGAAHKAVKYLEKKQQEAIDADAVRVEKATAARKERYEKQMEPVRNEFRAMPEKSFREALGRRLDAINLDETGTDRTKTGWMKTDLRSDAEREEATIIEEALKKDKLDQGVADAFRIRLDDSAKTDTDVVFNRSGRAYKTMVSATEAMKKKGLEDTHEVVRYGTGYALAKKEEKAPEAGGQVEGEAAQIPPGMSPNDFFIKGQETGKVEPKQVFSTKPPIPLIEEIVSEPEYFRDKKGVEAKLTWMSPDEYLKLQAKVKGIDLEQDLLIADEERIAQYADAMKKISSGEVAKQFPALWVEPAKQNQEGRHRALAAKRAGLEKLPVYFINEIPEAPPAPPTPIIPPQQTAQPSSTPEKIDSTANMGVEPETPVVSDIAASKPAAPLEEAKSGGSLEPEGETPSASTHTTKHPTWMKGEIVTFESQGKAYTGVVARDHWGDKTVSGNVDIKVGDQRFFISPDRVQKAPVIPKPKVTEEAPTLPPAKTKTQFEEGDRVVVNGKHGEISEKTTFTMQPIIGGGRSSEMYAYRVKFDSGRDAAVSDSQLTRETEKPTEKVVPDILIDVYGKGQAAYHSPEDVVDSIQNGKRHIVEFKEKATRAVKQANKQKMLKLAQDEEAYVAKLQAAFDSWADKNPEEAAKYRPAKTPSETAKAPVPEKKPVMPKPATPRAEQKPAIMPPPKKPAAAAEEKPIGKNADGEDIYEDAKGVRYVKEGNYIIEEAVFIVPTRAGVIPVIRHDDKRYIPVEQKAPTPPPPAEPKKEWGASNKIVSKEEADKAREILRKALGGIHANVPLSPEVVQAGIALATYHIEAGARTFNEYATKMIADIGDVIRPYLKQFYMNVKFRPGMDTTGMNTEVELNQIDENSIDLAEIGAKIESGGGEQNEHPADGGLSQRPLEENEPENLPENGEEWGSGEGERGGGETDANGNERLDAGEEDGTGSLGSEQTPIHLPDAEATGEELPALEDEEDQSTPVSEPRSLQLSGDNPGNYRITADDNIGSGTRGQKIDRNIAAIRLVKQLEQEKRYPTREEQSILAKYVGWGGLKSVLDVNSAKPQDINARKELETLLTKEEIFSAFLSITDAHYTSPEIISSIYDILRHMGFKGGNVLEPTYGAGNFLGLMPEDMSASSKWYGSELDPITAKIGQLLYPESQLIESGFQTAEFPYGKFDLAIGNPPFGGTRITDTKKNRAEINRFKIHNYVIAKEAMHLRPGGILANVVTTRFLDTADPEARGFLAKNFKFLGAIRLPNDAFAKNAGTTVTTDIIFLQRLMPDEKPEPNADWLQTGATIENSTGEIITLNKYFAERPYMMLGEPSMKGTMYGGAWKTGGKGEFTLDKREGQDTGALIKQLLSDHLGHMEDIFQERDEDKADAAALSLTINKEDVGIGGFYQEDGKIYLRGDDDDYGNPTFSVLSPETQWTEKRTLGQTRYDRIKGMLNLREKTYKLIEAERFDRENIEELRADLNKDYDAFVKEFGFLSEPANFGLMADDIKVEFGLESGYKKKITADKAKTLGIKPMPAMAIKAAILKERVFFPAKEIVFAKDVTDGYGISLSQKGKLDVEYLAELTGKPVDEVTAELSEKGLAFEDPETGKWIQEDEYLSGNVKEKYKIAKENGFGINTEALKKVFPADKEAERIYAGMGATWIPERVYAAFGDFIGVSDAHVSISHDTGRIHLSGSAYQNDVNVAWQNNDYGIVDIFNATAGHKALVAYDGSGDDRTVNRDRTKALGSIVKSMKSTFDDWLMADDERARTIVKEYNDTQNTHAPRKFDGTHLRTVGASPAIQLRNTQRNAAWRMIQAPKVLLDHVVGSGKTFTIITGIMERVRMGLTRKPMIVVPNHLVGQWAADWLKLYPGARILAATNKDFSRPNRRRLFSRITTGNYDAIIVGHSSFGFIPIEKETLRGLVMEEVEHLQRAHADAVRNGEKRIASGLAKRIQKKLEKIAELMNSPRDNVSHFEEMGIDHLVVDESHEFKNLEYSSAMQNVTGMGNPSGSKRAFDLYSKIRYLDTQPDTAVCFSTGTPISNSLVEMYALLRYMNRKGLVDRKLEAFDSWAAAYATTENRIEYTASQKLKDRVVMATFQNVRELVQLYEEFADTITMEDMKRSYREQIRESNRLTGANEREEFPIPNVEEGGRQLDLGEPDESQKKYVDYLVARAQRLEDLGRDNNPKVDNHLWLMSDARKMALDIRLVDPSAPGGENNKIVRAANTIKRIYDASAADKGTQLVFCDLSTPAKTSIAEAKAFISRALRVARLDKDETVTSLLQGVESFNGKWSYLRNRIEAEIDAISDSDLAETSAYMKRREYLETFLNEEATDTELSVLTTADTGFSVYDDMKSKLVDMGIPAGEIRFIHGANTADKKTELFGLVNAGAVRILIGSTPKMGAGTNVQERLVALHHMDAPWRPSDVEQREGRIIRQGNILYARDPEGFMVKVYAYSTKNTFDAVMWQILARKQGMLDDFRSGKDVIEDASSDTSSYADFMAETTGNPIFKEKHKLEGEIEELSATQRRIQTRRLSAEQSLRWVERQREDAHADLARFEQAQEALKKVDTNTFTYRGKEYVNDISDKEKEERDRLEAINEEHRATHEPIHNAIIEKVNKKYPPEERSRDLRGNITKAAADNAAAAGIYYQELLKKEGIDRHPKRADFDRSRIAKQDPEGATAAAINIRNTLNNIAKEGEGGSITFQLGDVNIKIKVDPSGTHDKKGEPSGNSDFKIFVNDNFINAKWDAGTLYFDDLEKMLSAGSLLHQISSQIASKNYDLDSYRRTDEEARRTLDKLQFKDAEKLAAMKVRYDQVVVEVNQLEAEMESKRAEESNRYIERDHDRFGDYSPNRPARRDIEAPTETDTAEADITPEEWRLIEEADVVWDDYHGDDDYPIFMAKKARAIAILSQQSEKYASRSSGEYDYTIKEAQDRLDDAKYQWREDNGEPDDPEYPEEIQLAQKIINSIRQGQGKLASSGSLSLYGGIFPDPIAAAKALRDMAHDIKAALPKLEALGRAVYVSGERTIKEWYAAMKKHLGDLWFRFNWYLRGIWESLHNVEFKGSKGNKMALPLGNERGSFSTEKKGEEGPTPPGEEPPAPEAEREPEMKESRQAVRAQEDVFAAGMEDDFGDLVKYQTMSMKELYAAAQAIVNDDYAAAKRMAMGEEAPPRGIHAAAMYEAVKIRAIRERDLDTLMALATESTVPKMLSELGQAIKAADSQIIADPIRAMRDVVMDREARAKRLGIENQDDEIKRLRKMLDEVQADLDKKTAELEAKAADAAIDKIIEDETPKEPERQPLKPFYGVKNKIVTKAEYEKTRAELRDIFSGTTLSAGIDPTIMVKLVKVGVYHIEAGLRDFKAWAQRMTEDLGEGAKPHLPEIWDASQESYKKEVLGNISKKIEKVMEEKPDAGSSEISIYAHQMAKFFIQQGTRDRETLVDQVHEVLKTLDAEITREETKDAISGYGKFKPLSQEEADVILRDIKGQLQQLAKLRDIMAGIPPSKTGVEHRAPSDEERRLIKQVEAAKRKYGIKTTDKATQLKSALDAIKTRLRNQISDMEEEIKTGKKIVKGKSGVIYDAEANALMKRRDELKAIEARIFGKPGMSDEQRAKIAVGALQTQIAEYRQRIRSGDISPLRKKGKTSVSSPQILQLREDRDQLRKEFKALRDLANPKKSKEEIALKALKTRLKTEYKKINERFKTGNLTIPLRKEAPMDAEARELKAKRDQIRDRYNAAKEINGMISPQEAQSILDLSNTVAEKKADMEAGGNRLEYGAAVVAFEKYIEDLKGHNAPVRKKIGDRWQEFQTTFARNKSKAVMDMAMDSIKTVTETSISLVASLDNSFIGRQGLKVLMTHPSAWWPAAKASFSDFAKTVGGEEALDAMLADIYSRPNFVNGNYGAAKLISKTEEQFPTTLPERMPGLGRLFKASNAAFRGSALRMRADLFDMLSKVAEEGGQNLDKQFLQDLGKLINSLTARGQWGKKGEGTLTRIILWAPKMLKANIDVLTAHRLDRDMESAFVKRQAAINLVKVIVEVGLIMAIANALRPGSAEIDPRSTDFGKIKIGDTRFDFTGGMGSIVTLAARILTWSAKSAATGIVSPLSSKYNERSPFDVLTDFLVNKTSPPARVIVDWLRGKNWKGERFNLGGATYQAFTPIMMQNILQLKDKASADRLLGIMADAVGISAQSFTASEVKWDKEQSKQMGEFYRHVGSKRFEQANERYNRGVNQWFEQISKTKEWRRKTEEDKLKTYRQGKRDIRDRVFASYGF